MHLPEEACVKDKLNQLCFSQQQGLQRRTSSELYTCQPASGTNEEKKKKKRQLRAMLNFITRLRATKHCMKKLNDMTNKMPFNISIQREVGDRHPISLDKSTICNKNFKTDERTPKNGFDLYDRSVFINLLYLE